MLNLSKIMEIESLDNSILTDTSLFISYENVPAADSSLVNVLTYSAVQTF